MNNGNPTQVSVGGPFGGFAQNDFYLVNRLTSQSYYVSGGSCSSNNTSSPATSNVTYVYDSGATNARGRLFSITNSAAVDAVSGYL